MTDALARFPLGTRQALIEWSNQCRRLKHVSLTYPCVGCLHERVAEMRNLLVNCVNQWTIENGRGQYAAGGLSVVEALFRFFGLPNPCSEAQFGRAIERECRAKDAA